MKNNFLLLALFATSSAVGMRGPQTPRPIYQEFGNAVKAGNAHLVYQIFYDNPTLAQDLKGASEFTSHAYLGLTKSPQLKSEYMQILRFLQTQGAPPFHPKIIKELEEYERAQQTAAPVYQQPTYQQPPRPAPVVTPPAVRPTTAATPAYTAAPAKPVQPQPQPPVLKPTPAGMAPANFETLADLMMAIRSKGGGILSKPDEIREYLQTHSINNLSDKEIQELLTSVLNQISATALFSYDTLKPALKTLRVMLEKGFVPTTAYNQKLLSDLRKGTGSNRSSQFPTDLVKAINDRKGLAEVKRLVEQEGEDVNQAGFKDRSPLEAAMFADSRDVAEYLLSKGATIDSVPSYQREQFFKFLGRRL